MMFVILKGSVTYQGRNAVAGEGIVLPERSAKSLVAAGLAEFTSEQPQKDAVNELKSEGGSNLPDEGQKGQEEDVALLAKAIEDQYKRDELAEAAKLIGVEFKYDAKKAEIITAAIEQGKAAALLK